MARIRCQEVHQVQRSRVEDGRTAFDLLPVERLPKDGPVTSWALRRACVHDRARGHLARAAAQAPHVTAATGLANDRGPQPQLDFRLLGNRALGHGVEVSGGQHLVRRRAAVERNAQAAVHEPHRLPALLDGALRRRAVIFPVAPRAVVRVLGARLDHECSGAARAMRRESHRQTESCAPAAEDDQVEIFRHEVSRAPSRRRRNGTARHARPRRDFAMAPRNGVEAGPRAAPARLPGS